MEKQAYVFIGQSGAGKGTQAVLLEKEIRSRYPDESILHLETGAVFRSFITGSSYTAQETKRIMDDGKLPPPFIGIHVWSHELINQYSGQRFVLIDGTPRISVEVPVLLSAAKFYGWKLTVIYLDVSDAWATARLLDRGRADDREEHDRAGRVAWFHDNVIPAIELLREAPDVQFISINGERPILEIHAEIRGKLGL
jgi:adenylate kinase family enzyme